MNDWWVNLEELIRAKHVQTLLYLIKSFVNSQQQTLRFLLHPLNHRYVSPPPLADQIMVALTLMIVQKKISQHWHWGQSMSDLVAHLMRVFLDRDSATATDVEITAPLNHTELELMKYLQDLKPVEPEASEHHMSDSTSSWSRVWYRILQGLSLPTHILRTIRTWLPLSGGMWLTLYYLLLKTAQHHYEWSITIASCVVLLSGCAYLVKRWQFERSELGDIMDWLYTANQANEHRSWKVQLKLYRQYLKYWTRSKDSWREILQKSKLQDIHAQILQNLHARQTGSQFNLIEAAVDIKSDHAAMNQNETKVFDLWEFTITGDTNHRLKSMEKIEHIKVPPMPVFKNDIPFWWSPDPGVNVNVKTDWSLQLNQSFMVNLVNTVQLISHYCPYILFFSGQGISIDTMEHVTFWQPRQWLEVMYWRDQFAQSLASWISKENTPELCPAYWGLNLCLIMTQLHGHLNSHYFHDLPLSHELSSVTSWRMAQVLLEIKKFFWYLIMFCQATWYNRWYLLSGNLYALLSWAQIDEFWHQVSTLVAPLQSVISNSNLPSEINFLPKQQFLPKTMSMIKEKLERMPESELKIDTTWGRIDSWALDNQMPHVPLEIGWKYRILKHIIWTNLKKCQTDMRNIVLGQYPPQISPHHIESSDSLMDDRHWPAWCCVTQIALLLFIQKPFPLNQAKSVVENEKSLIQYRQDPSNVPIINAIHDVWVYGYLTKESRSNLHQANLVLPNQPLTRPFPSTWTLFEHLYISWKETKFDVLLLLSQLDHLKRAPFKIRREFYTLYQMAQNYTDLLSQLPDWTHDTPIHKLCIIQPNIIHNPLISQTLKLVSLRHQSVTPLVPNICSRNHKIRMNLY
jgi:hypothetical protein